MSIFQYGDPAERAYALEKGLFIRFIAMNTALSAEFKAFLTSYDDRRVPTVQPHDEKNRYILVYSSLR